MPIRNYPFIEPKRDGTYALSTPKSGPKLWVRLENPSTSLALNLWAIVDTGASACLAPAGAAHVLGINLKSVPDTGGNTAGGKTEVYLHRVRISILGVHPNGTANELEILHRTPIVTVGFSPGNSPVLLGQAGFLEHFNLSVRYPERKFSIRRPDIRPKKKVKKRKH